MPANGRWDLIRRLKVKTNLTKYFKISILLEFHIYVSLHDNIGHIVSVTVLYTQINRRHQTGTTAKDEKSHNSCTYLLTAWSRVLLEKLTGLQLVKKFPALYGTQKFITAFTSACHLSLS